MRRAVLTLLVLSLPLFLVATSPAQRWDRPNPYEQQDDDPTNGAHLLLTDIIHHATQTLGVTFLYNEMELSSETVFIHPAPEALPTEPAELWRFFGVVLRSRGFGWANTPVEGVYEILRVDVVARTIPPVVTDPADIPMDACFAALWCPLRFAEPNSAQRALMNLMSRPGGVIQPIQMASESGDMGARGLLISDYPFVLERMYEFLREVDRPAEPRAQEELRTLLIPTDHLQPAVVASVLSSLFPSEVSSNQLTLTVVPEDQATDSTRNLLFVRCRPALEAELRATIAVIDAEQ